MIGKRQMVVSCLALMGLGAAQGIVEAQEATPTATAPAAQTGLTTLTIFLRHDQSQTLDEINERLRRQHFYEGVIPLRQGR